MKTHDITVTVSDAPPIVRYIKALNAEIERLRGLLTGPCPGCGQPVDHWCDTENLLDDQSRVFAPDPARAATVRRTLTDRIPHFNTSNDEGET